MAYKYIRMTALDVTILLIALVSAVYGYRRGIIRQVGAIAGVAAGVLACRFFGGALSEYFAGNNPSADHVYITGVFTNVVLFIAGFIGAWLVCRVIKCVSSTLHLSAIDRLCGAAFSLVSWFFVFSLLLNVWQALKPQTDVMASANLFSGKPGEMIIDLAPTVIGSETAQTMLDKFNELKPNENNNDDEDER